MVALGSAKDGGVYIFYTRGEGFYAAYFRDLDGNKLDVFCYG